MRSLPLLLLLGACQGSRIECADLPDIVHGPAGLQIVAEEGHEGWGEARCFSCHSVERMHQVNCTGIPEVDTAAIRALVERGGEASCAACHGDNGVGP